jgi:ankyrin repeat protein
LKSRRFDLVKLLLSNGAQIDAIINQEQGVTALWHAANCGNEEDVRFLLDHGADPESQRGWRSPMQVAKERGRQNIIELLLAARGG